MTRHVLFVSLACALAFGGCGDDDTRVDSGSDTGRDGGGGDDAGDAARPDTGLCVPSAAAEDTRALCTDRIDNDCNGFTDCDDFACSRNPAVMVCD